MTGPLHRLSDVFDDCVRTAFHGIRHVVLLDYPNHGNVGDNAIWLGEVQFLRNHGITIDLVADIPRYSRRQVSSTMRRPNGAIVLHGGGNFGDIYPKHQAFRSRVAQDHPEHRIIQMPQSVHFDKPDAELAGALRQHPDFHMFARDERSQVQASSLFCREVMLAPDAAHHCLLDMVPSSRDFVVLARVDRERTAASSAESVDWVVNPTGFDARWNRAHRAVCRRVPGATGLNWTQDWTWERLARQHLRRGCRLIGDGRTVVTDRLHAMLLGLEMGRRVIAVENRIGKLGDYTATWGIGESDGLTFAPTFDAATAWLRRGGH